MAFSIAAPAFVAFASTFLILLSNPDVSPVIFTTISPKLGIYFTSPSSAIVIAFNTSAITAGDMTFRTFGSFFFGMKSSTVKGLCFFFLSLLMFANSEQTNATPRL
jgi:hypothetical protein